MEKQKNDREIDFKIAHLVDSIPTIVGRVRGSNPCAPTEKPHSVKWVRFFYLNSIT